MPMAARQSLKKRITVSIFIPLILFALLLTGCSSDKPNNSNQNEIFTPGPNESTNIPHFLGINRDVKEFIKEDIDLDGKTEIVIAFLCSGKIPRVNCKK